MSIKNNVRLIIDGVDGIVRENYSSFCNDVTISIKDSDDNASAKKIFEGLGELCNSMLKKHRDEIIDAYTEVCTYKTSKAKAKDKALISKALKASNAFKAPKAPKG